MSPKDYYYDNVLDRISDYAANASRHIRHLNAAVPPLLKGELYAEHIVPFVLRANQVAITTGHIIQDIAHRIGGPEEDCVLSFDQKKRLYLKLANAISWLSEHPTKKAGAILMSPKGFFLGWGVNRVPSGLKRIAEFYVEKERKEYIVCAERMAMADALGLKLNLPKSISERDKLSLAQTREIIAEFSQNIITFGGQNDKLTGSYLIATALPCHICAEQIAACGIKTVITNGNGGRDFKRRKKMEMARETLSAQGISVITL